MVLPLQSVHLVTLVSRGWSCHKPYLRFLGPHSQVQWQTREGWGLVITWNWGLLGPLGLQGLYIHVRISSSWDLPQWKTGEETNSLGPSCCKRWLFWSLLSDVIPTQHALKDALKKLSAFEALRSILACSSCMKMLETWISKPFGLFENLSLEIRVKMKWKGNTEDIQGSYTSL